MYHICCEFIFFSLFRFTFYEPISPDTDLDLYPIFFFYYLKSTTSSCGTKPFSKWPNKQVQWAWKKKNPLPLWLRSLHLGAWYKEKERNQVRPTITCYSRKLWEHTAFLIDINMSHYRGYFHYFSNIFCLGCFHCEYGASLCHPNIESKT